MKHTKERILEELRENNGLSMDKLVESIVKSTSGIRGRISELRKSGIKIDNTQGIYRLITDNTPEDKILGFVEKTQSYNVPMDYSVLAKRLKLSDTEIRDGMYRIFKKGKLLQVTNDTARILP